MANRVHLQELEHEQMNRNRKQFSLMSESVENIVTFQSQGPY